MLAEGLTRGRVINTVPGGGLPLWVTERVKLNSQTQGGSEGSLVGWDRRGSIWMGELDVGVSDQPALQAADTMELRTKVRGRGSGHLKGQGERVGVQLGRGLSFGICFCAEPTRKKGNEGGGSF